MMKISALLLVVLAAPFGPSPALTSGGRLAAADAVSGSRSEAYRQGQRALEEERWDDAARAFSSLIREAGPETDPALYWKAYADWKARRKKAALEGLRHLLSSYPQSPWADDAKALELEIRGARGSKEQAEVDGGEELKLYALDGLLQIEPEKAMPVLERLLAGDSSLRVKERALFVLSQSEVPRARETLVRIAKTGEPPELRREAVQMLGIAGGPEDIAALSALAREAPRDMREAVVEAYLVAGRPDELGAIARKDPDPAVRAKAIEALAAIGALPILRELWSNESEREARSKLLEAFGIAGDVETLSTAARESTDPELRQKAIEGLGITGSPEAARTLRELYGRLPDPTDKRKVLDAFLIQGDAKTMIELFRAERDPAMKKTILERLTVMDDPEATRIILDALGEKP